jgi:hypothetical protein
MNIFKNIMSLSKQEKSRGPTKMKKTLPTSTKTKWGPKRDRENVLT